MKSFLQRFGSLVLGVLHGFDRLRLRGSKRLLCNPGGVSSFLSQAQVPLKDYQSYAKETTVALGITPASKIRTNPASRFRPTRADRDSPRIQDSPRKTRKPTEKRIRINTPFPCPFRGAAR